MASFRDPRTGRFVTKARFDQIAKAIERAEQRARERAARAFVAREESVPGSARERGATRRLRAATGQRRKVEHQRESVREQRRARPVAFAGWQIGVEYRARYHTAKGRAGGHDVDFNINIRRTDGEPMTRDEAEAVLRDYRSSQSVPRGYAFEAVTWRRPGHHWRTGGEGDADAFYGIIASTSLASFRFGSLGEDEV